MTGRSAGSIRARVRAEMTEEIKAVARRHLAAEGANLSLRAVARDMGMVSSALYRYFASRDELLTALIIDAYNSMGEAAEAADAAVTDRGDLTRRWLTVTHALRDWALARPHEYALIYGSPVPGYAAPQDTIGPASRPVIVFGAILAEALPAGAAAAGAAATGATAADGGPAADGRSTDGGGPAADRGPADGGGPPAIPRALRAELQLVAGTVGASGLDERTLARALIAWTEVFGAISFELFGRLNNVINERTAWFDHQMRMMLAFIGVGPQ